MANYTRYKIKIKDKIKKFFGIYPPFGRNPCIKKIIVQNPEKLPSDIKGKGEFLALKQLVNRLTKENKDKIVRAFLNKNLMKSFFNLNQGKRTLLLTQPFSENKAITETQKITLYKNIIDKYLDNDELLIIKPHPAEKTDYTTLSLYKNLIQLPREFPIELINLMTKFNITKAITLFSSAIDNIDIPQKITICPNPFDCPELMFPSGNNSTI